MSKNTEKASQMILKAVIASVLNLRDGKTSKINPVDVMSQDVGIELALLLAEDNEQYHADVDWGARIFDWYYFLREILILLGKPGVLSKLPENHRETASSKISKLIDFFERINDERFTNQWLTWLMLTQHGSSQSQEVIDRQEEYYDFEKRNSRYNSFFHCHEINRFKKMEQAYIEAHQSDSWNLD